MADKNIKLRLDYSDFTGSISECKSKMQMLTEQFKLQEAELGNNASEIDKLALSQETLNQKISLQEQVVAQAAEKLATLASSEEATERQVDAAHKAFIKQETILQNLKNELNDTEEKLKQTSDAEGQVADKSTLASENVDKMSGSFSTAISTITAIAGALTSVANEIDSVARASASAADDINTMAQIYGVSKDTMESWVATAELTDVSAETLGSSMSKLTRAMSSAASGSTETANKFKALGVSVTDSNGKLKSTEDVFYEVMRALSAMDNAAERDAAAMSLLGRSAQQLNPILNMGVDSFKSLTESARDVIPDQFQQQLEALDDSFAEFDNAMQQGQNTLVGALAPALSAVLNGVAQLDPAFLAIVQAGKMFFGALQALVPIITMVNTAQMAGAATTMMDVTAKEADTIATVQTTGANMTFIESIGAVVATMMPQILTIAALVAALALLGFAIAAIVEAFNESSDAADKATDSYSRLTSAAGNISTPNLATMTSHYASGSTTGGAGGLAWVGEQGAELVQLPLGSTVYNHEESKSMASTSNVFNVTIDAKNVKDFNSVVRVFSGLDQSMNRGGFVNG